MLTKSTSDTMDWRCKSCNALLGRFKHAVGEIKCKCGVLNAIKLVSQKVLLTEDSTPHHNHK